MGTAFVILSIVAVFAAYFSGYAYGLTSGEKRGYEKAAKDLYDQLGKYISVKFEHALDAKEQ